MRMLAWQFGYGRERVSFGTSCALLHSLRKKRVGELMVAARSGDAMPYLYATRRFSEIWIFGRQANATRLDALLTSALEPAGRHAASLATRYSRLGYLSETLIRSATGASPALAAKYIKSLEQAGRWRPESHDHQGPAYRLAEFETEFLSMLMACLDEFDRIAI